MIWTISSMRLRVKPGSLEWRLPNNSSVSWMMRWRFMKGTQIQLDSDQGLQPLNEYDLVVLPTIPWALISPPKIRQCLMIPGTLGWAPTLINEPHLRGASIPGDTMVMSSVRTVFPLDVERLSELARFSHYVFPLINHRLILFLLWE